METFGISWMVLKTAKFNQQELKHFNAMPFTLDFESDETYNFLVEEE